MKVSKFFVVLLVLFGIAAVIYAVSTPSTKYIQLTGIVTGTDEIVSPLIQGRLSRLLVDEGSEVKAGQLIAEIDPTEFKAQRDAAADNIRTLQARLQQSTVTQSMNAAADARGCAAGGSFRHRREGPTRAGARHLSAQRNHLQARSRRSSRRT